MPSPSTEFTFVIGAVLIAAGWWFLRRQRRSADPPGGESAEEQVFDQHDIDQRRRRQKMAILLIVLGILLPAGRLTFENIEGSDRLVQGLYWVGVLSLVAWMLVLAVIDMFKVAARTRAALDRVRADQAALERDLRNFRASRPSNDRH